MEYKITTVPDGTGLWNYRCEKHLNEMAEQGWKFVQFLVKPGPNTSLLWERIKVHQEGDDE